MILAAATTAGDDCNRSACPGAARHRRRRGSASTWRAALLASSALCVTPLITAPATAQNATWLSNPGSSDFNTGSNWSPAVVPTGTAFFGTSSQTTVSFSANTTIGGWTLSTGASNYTFFGGNDLTFTGAGIVVNGGSAVIENDANLQFQNASTAGSATINNNHAGNVIFSGTSTAGNAAISNSGVLIFSNSSTADHASIGTGFDTDFTDNSTAGSASIVNSGALNFSNNSSAGSSTITNMVLLQFFNASTAGSATITNENSANTYFTDTSTAGNGTIANNGSLSFSNTSSAGTAIIANANTLNFNDTSTASGAVINNDGNLQFQNASTAGSATINNNHAGNVIFSGISTAGNAAIGNSGVLIFSNSSTADHATIGTGFDTDFTDNSTAGSASIVNSGALNFSNNSSAGSSTLTNMVLLQFFNASTAGSATITTASSANTYFADTSSGGSARLIAEGGGTFDFSRLNSSGTTAGSIEGDGSYLLGAKTLTVGSNDLSTEVRGVIADGGTSGGVGGALVKVGTGTLTLTGANTYSGGTTINGGVLAIAADNNLGAATGSLTFGGGALQFLSGFSSSRTVTLNAGGGTFDTNGNNNTLAGPIGGAGSLTKIGTGTLVLSGNNSYGGGTTIGGGTLQADQSAALGTGLVTFTGRAGTLMLNNADLTNAIAIGNDAKATIDALGPAALDGTATLDANSTLALNPSNGGLNNTLFLANSSATVDSTARVDIQGGVAPLTTGGAALLGGNVNIGALGRLDLNNQNVTISALTGSGNITSTASAQTLAVGSGDFAGTMTNNGPGVLSLAKFGGGTFALTGSATYTGSTLVNGGTLEVDGTITNTSGVTVNSGGTLSGIGLIDPPTVTIMNGGTLAPGNAANPAGTLTIEGNLAFQSGALYLVQVAGSTAGSTHVSGTAALTGGTVNVQFGPDASLKNKYTILTAAGGLNSTTFAGLTSTSLPAGVSGRLSYDSNSVFLDLAANMGPGTALNQNQQNVANALNNFFNGGGTLPARFANLFGLTGGNLTNALSQLDGEAATGAERAAFRLTNQFLDLMLDPNVNGRGRIGPGGPAIGFAPDREAVLPPDIALAYASVFQKTSPQSTFDQRWTAWAAAYGGGDSANGNATIGSTNITTGAFGFAGGMDYHFTPNTVAGFALAGGGTNWGLGNALGTGRSDALQIGAYGASSFGPAYVAGALSFSNHWFTTSRTALGDELSANFAGQSYGARLEGGFRHEVLPGFAVTPYGAVQFQDFNTAAHREDDAGGGGLGLSYNAKNATDMRTELGARFDDRTLLGDKPLILFGRLAWAHDFVGNPALSAAFEALPGSSFTVNGALIPHDSAWTAAGVQLLLAPRWTLLAQFEGEFAGGSQSYAGSGTLRRTW